MGMAAAGMGVVMFVMRSAGVGLGLMMIPMIGRRRVTRGCPRVQAAAAPPDQVEPEQHHQTIAARFQ
jgi:hypothetical protein